MARNKKHKRVLLKISGEILQGKAPFGHDLNALEYIAKEIASIKKIGAEICLVIGGGNLLRGRQFDGGKLIKPATADYMGMLATIMNALAVQDAIRSSGFGVHIFSSIPMHTMCEPYCLSKALTALEDGNIVIFAGGIGNPFVTTDTVSVIKSIEMECDMLLKGTQVDGVYDSDPKKNKSAKRYNKITHEDVIEKGLTVMDLPAIHIAKSYDLPIVVFDLHKQGNLLRIIKNGKTKIQNFSLIS